MYSPALHVHERQSLMFKERLSELQSNSFLFIGCMSLKCNTVLHIIEFQTLFVPKTIYDHDVLPMKRRLFQAIVSMRK